MHQAAGGEGERRRGAHRQKLGGAVATEFARDQASQHHRDGASQRGEEAKPGERSAEELQ